MKRIHDLSGLPWTVTGFTPYLWLLERTGAGTTNIVDQRPVPAQVPGSVQGALRAAGILPDWNVGLASRDCEWVEHRHWMYRTRIPDAWLDASATMRLDCQGLDYSGWVYVNGKEAGTFKGTHLPHAFDLTGHLKDRDNELEIIFDLPPRWLGQFGFTSAMTDWKPRYNYTWDWVPRLVQAGIWGPITLAAVKGSELADVNGATDADVSAGTGILELSGEVTPGEADGVIVTLEHGGNIVRTQTCTVAEFARGVRWTDLQVQLWWPNLQGPQPLYSVTCVLRDRQGRELDRWSARVGFKHVQWQPCEGAPAGADPWLCVINGRGVFLQGVNFAPLQANFADLRQEDYDRRLRQYHALGANLLRINGCQFLETPWFYDLCDELGLMVWQDFPLTSSGIENWPPEDPVCIEEMARIAASFIRRRRHHASLLIWAGGNELMGDLQGRKVGMGKPCDLSHPMLARLGQVAAELDPHHRYIATSPSGPRSSADPADFGKGLHWDVHGGAGLGTLKDARKYWAGDDALFRSELYCPGASSVEGIVKYAGNMPTFPATEDNPYWTRLTPWWLDWKRLIAIHGRQPQDLAEYVQWSQANQAQMLGEEMAAIKARFPRCAGVLLWSGHDTWPIAANTSLIEFDGTLKPAAHAVARVWRADAGAATQPSGGAQ